MIKLFRTTFFLWAVLLVTSSFASGSFDHEYVDWGEVLAQHVEDGRVDYAGIQKNSKTLETFLKSVKVLAPGKIETWSRNEQMAFWINVYNAVTVKTVIDHYPIEKNVRRSSYLYPANSIRQIARVWDNQNVEVAEEKMSLNAVEHKILRARFNDPRVHMALVCASVGCPDIRAEPFTAQRLDEQLDDQSYEFLRNPEKARFDAGRDTLFLSPIFKWFGKDFDAVGGVAAFVRSHLPAAAGATDHTRLEWLDYDWRLNDRAPIQGVSP